MTFDKKLNFFVLVKSYREKNKNCETDLIYITTVAGPLQHATLSKKWLQHRFFRVNLQHFCKHNFSEHLPGIASKGSSYFVFKHKVDLRRCKEISIIHIKIFLWKQIIGSKYENFNGIFQEFLIVATHVDNLHWFDLIEAAVQRYFYEKVFWKYAANLQESTHAKVWFQ